MQQLQHSELKGSKGPEKLRRNKSSLFLIFLGLLIFIFGAANYYRVRVLSFSKIPSSDNSTNTDVPTEIIIPSLDLDLNVETGSIKDGVWNISPSNATFLNISSPPGSGGNTVIYGHNKRKIFGNLPYVSIGQQISVKTKSGQVYHYVVDQKYFVSPDRVDLVSPTTTAELTLYTCWGLFDSQRAVIKAKLF